MVQALFRLLRRQSIHCALTLVLLSGLPVANGAGENEFEAPQPLPTERYSPIWERSPFALKVAVGPDVPTRSFAENFALAGLSDVEGQITVYLKDKVSGEYTKLTNQTPSDSGIAFEKIVEDPDPKLVKVSLRKGNETAQVGYSQEPVGVGAGGSAGPSPAQMGTLGKKPAAIPPGPPSPGSNAPAGADPNAQQKGRRRIILPQAGPPQGSLLTPPAGRGGLVGWVPLAIASGLAAHTFVTPLNR